MICQYVKHWTLGWDESGKMIPVPVLTRLVDCPNGTKRFKDDTIDIIALERQCTIALLNPKKVIAFNTEEVMTVGQMVVMKHPMAFNEAKRLFEATL